MYLATCKFTFFSFPNWFYKIAKCLVVKWIKCEYQRLTITEEQLWMNISCVVQVDMEILFPFWGWQRRGKAKPQTGCPRIYSNCEHCFGLGTSLKNLSPETPLCCAWRWLVVPHRQQPSDGVEAKSSWCKVKGRQFDAGSGHRPGLQAQTDVSLPPFPALEK